MECMGELGWFALFAACLPVWFGPDCVSVIMQLSWFWGVRRRTAVPLRAYREVPECCCCLLYCCNLPPFLGLAILFCCFLCVRAFRCQEGVSSLSTLVSRQANITPRACMGACFMSNFLVPVFQQTAAIAVCVSPHVRMSNDICLTFFFSPFSILRQPTNQTNSQPNMHTPFSPRTCFFFLLSSPGSGFCSILFSSSCSSGEPLPAAGFGFGDAVIIELLSDKGLLPKDKGPGVTAVVFAWDAGLQVFLFVSALFVRRVFFLVWR